MDDDRQIESLSSHVLANLSVEELEQRLELQMLQMGGMADCFVNYCGADCDSNCIGNCPSNCIGNCPTLCGADCPTLCAANCSPNCPSVLPP